MGSAIEKNTRKLIILSFEEPAGPRSGPVEHATALPPSGPFIQDFWSTPLKRVTAWQVHSMPSRNLSTFLPSRTRAPCSALKTAQGNIGAVFPIAVVKPNSGQRCE